MAARRALWLLLGCASLSAALALSSGPTGRAASSSQGLQQQAAQQNQPQQRHEPRPVHDWLLYGAGSGGAGPSPVADDALNEVFDEGLVPRLTRPPEPARQSPAKRSHKQQQQQVAQQALASVGRGAAAQFFTRSTRASRRYDVPQIECPLAEDGMERFACPTPDDKGRFRCIDDHVLCDGFRDCPNYEDEDMQACMFYKTTKAHLDVLADALLRWARG